MTVTPSRFVLTTQSTSRNSASLTQPVPIRESANGLTRRAVAASFVNNPGHPDRRLEVSIIHEKRARVGAPWEPVNTLPLQKLKAGEWVQLAFNSEDTRALITALEQLYAASAAGPVSGINEWTVVRPGTLIIDGEKAEILSELLADYGNDNLFALLAGLRPGLSEFVARKQIYDERERAVRVFETHMEQGDWLEGAWQRFFNANTWMFGVGLRYVFLDLVQAQPTVGPHNLTGRGAIKSDYLTSTSGTARFTVLVEIKTPGVALLEARPYRNEAYTPGGHLSGGVAQVQTQCEAWSRSAVTPQNAGLDARTVQPKGLLVIGDLASIAGDREREIAFETYRRNVANPEIITFDELLERARFVLGESRTPAAPTKPRAVASPPRTQAPVRPQPAARPPAPRGRY